MCDSGGLSRKLHSIDPKASKDKCRSVSKLRKRDSQRRMHQRGEMTEHAIQIPHALRYVVTMQGQCRDVFQTPLKV